MIQEQDILLQASGLGRRDGRNMRLEGLDLVLRPGQVLGLLGVNGAGKSTTLALLSGALRPTSGRVEILGIDLHRHPRRAKRHLGLLPERPPLYPNLTVDENLDFAARLRGLKRKAARAAREQVKRQLDLAAFGRRLCGRLSKGMAQRVGIAQALIHQPQVLILDEPTAGLDPVQASELRALIGEIRSRCGILLATHILRDVEQLCEEVVILREGRLAAHEHLHEQNRARIHLLQPPASECLERLPGVAGVQELGSGWFDLLLDQAPGDLAREIALHDWGLAAYVPRRHDIEHLVNTLVGVDQEAA